MKNNRDKQIREGLSLAAKQMIPEDMYDRIRQNIAQEERTINMDATINRNETKNSSTAKKRYPARWISIATAACILLACGLFGGNYYRNNLAIDSIVDIDVNPGIEISTNKNDRVLNVNAVNSDAEKVLDGMNFKNVELKVAVNALVGSMVRNGYLIDGENSILVTVQNDDAQRTTHIRNLIVSDIDASLKDNHVAASVVNQTATDRTDAKEFAAAQGISFGKAVFILNLCTKDSTLDRTALAKMNMRDIAALIVEKGIDIRDIADYDADDSIWENVAGAIEDTDEDNNAAQSDPAISAAKAKEIALSHAGISAAEASFSQAELDTDDGTKVYHIEFTSGGVEYEYEINARTGAVISADKEAADDHTDDNNTQASVSGNTVQPATSVPETAAPEPETAAPPQTPVITAAKAKEAALNHAGVPAASANFIKVELDQDDDVQKYEVEFCVGSMEYDYEIDALTGSVMHYESEMDD